MASSLDLDSRTLVTRIADLLREQILTGQLAPGARIRQDEFAENFGVSRTPLREAFRLLESEGWIEIRPRSGVSVSQFSPAEVQDILAMRLLLEPLAIKVAAYSHDEAETVRLQAIFESLHSAQHEHQNNTATYDSANEDFHFALYGMSVNTTTNPLYSSLRSYWERYARYRRVYYARTADSVEDSSSEHDGLLRAWIARDGDAAEQLVAQHILRAGISLLRSLTQDATPAISLQITELARRYRYQTE